jgi:hypothetical protein
MARDYPDDVQAILTEHRERVVETVDALHDLVRDLLQQALAIGLERRPRF